MARHRLGLFWISALLALPLYGCSDALNAGPLEYVANDALTKDVEGKPNLAGKPAFQQKVRAALTRLFGESPQRIKVPEGSGLPEGGLYLASYMQEGEGPSARYVRLYEDAATSVPTKVTARASGGAVPQAGGYAIYRRNCLHCHGVSGAGDGPTSPFLYPPPRDYRRGIFKFTSTPYMARPTRDDLRRTIRNGLHGTSMPAFHSLLNNLEIEQVIDYVMFLSMRGETELALIEIAALADEKDPESFSDEIVKEAVDAVFKKWQPAQTQVVNPPVPRTPPDHESIVRGRDLFLKTDCKDCHGTLARGDGGSFVPQDVFNAVVFGGNPSERQSRLDKYDAKIKDMWKQKPDEWGNPLRPANLNRSVYKGGRRPIDIYWRIAKGINGSQMPGHYPSINEQQIWDLVNFVLALPYEPELLTHAPTGAATPEVASSSAAGL
jgi:mono/diheme cytochrome c family protein